MIKGGSWYNENLIWRVERIAANNFTLYFVGGGTLINVTRNEVLALNLQGVDLP